jgi:predicted metal-dependent hydrolase
VSGPNPRCSAPAPPELLEGIRLFNAGEYFECHEVLESIWRAERDPVRYLYQGILQVGVGLHHLRNGNFRGATLLLRDGIDKTSHFRPACLGVDTATLCDQAQRCLDQLHALGRERIAEFNWALAPAIALPDRAPGAA